MSGKVVICGHTRQLSGWPLDLGCAVCIDTGAYAGGGWLTCLEVETGRFVQANQKGVLSGTPFLSAMISSVPRQEAAASGRLRPGWSIWG